MNIKLNMRYPESRQEDITDAFTRGYTEAVEASNNTIKKLEAENAKLREEIVRCGDCKYASIDQSDHDYREPLWCGFHRMDVKPDSFCAWGKRKVDARDGN